MSETAIEQKDLVDWVKKQISDIIKLVEIIRDPTLSKCKRGIIGALITLDVHGRDVTKAMVEDKVNSLEDFLWMAQLRYYWGHTFDIRMLTS